VHVGLLLEIPLKVERVITVPVSDKMSYGVGNLATGIAMQILGTYLVFYSTAILHLPGRFIGMVMGVSILWDAVTDPVMGYVSDRTRSKRLGKRHPYLIAGAVGIALTNYLIWNIAPALSPGVKLVLISACILLFKTFMTIYVTPYTALGAELSVDYYERTSIQGIKSIFFILGLAFVSVAGMYVFFKPSQAFPVGQLNPRAYSMMGSWSSIVVVLAAVWCFVATLKYVPLIRTRDRAPEGAVAPGFRSAMSHAFGNKPFRKVVYSYTFSNLASALMANLGMIVFTYTFGLGGDRIAAILAVQFLFAILSQPVWMAVSTRYGKMPALVLGFCLGIAGSVWFAILVILNGSVQDNVLAFMPFALCVGSGIGALFTLPLSMVADTVDLDEAGGGTRNEGVYFGSLTLVYKLSQAVAIIVIGVMLDITGFDSSLPRQASSTLVSLGMILGLGGIASFVAAIACLRGYDLTEKAVEDCREQIAGRKRTGIV
jgi:Na+/melibiose symporter-like transporter